MNDRASAPDSRLDRIVDRTLQNHPLLSAGEAVLVGVSGGPDSVALLHLLWDRAPARGLRLAIAHLHHGLRPAADRDEEFVRRMALERGLPFYSRRADLRGPQKRRGLSIEEAARQVRYAFLDEIATQRGFAKIALGHHADDSAETLLLNLLRGSGRLGLAGIPAVRDGKYIRPLILAHRADITAYVEARGLATVTDDSNAEETYTRNRIRGRLIPHLERDYHPRVRSVLGRTGLILRDEEQWLESLIDPLLNDTRVADGDGWIVLTASTLSRMHVAAARRVIRRAIHHAKGDLRRLQFDHVERIRAMTQRSDDAGPLDLPDRIRVWRRGPHIEIAADAGAAARGLLHPPPDYAYTVSGCGQLRIEETGECLELAAVSIDALPSPLAAGPQQAFLDLDIARFPLVVRNFRAGDRFTPLGVAGTQKLKKYFVDHKVGRDERRRCPLLVCEGRVLWVAGHRLDASAAVTPRTRRVLTVVRRLAKP
ncbi:MAG: tRNA lysidine(34) synthetase TilS [Desulfobacterales bacterium]